MRSRNSAAPLRTPERNRQVRLPLGNVMRQQINQQIRDASDKLRGLRKRSYVPVHAQGALPRQILERGNVIRIREETERRDTRSPVGRQHAVAIPGSSKAESGSRFPCAAHGTSRRDRLLQLMHVELAGVDARIGQPSNRVSIRSRSRLMFSATLLSPPSSGCGRRAGLTSNLRRIAASSASRKISRTGTGVASASCTSTETRSSADPSRIVHNNRSLANKASRTFRPGSRELRNQIDGEIVDRVITPGLRASLQEQCPCPSQLSPVMITNSVCAGVSEGGSASFAAIGSPRRIPGDNAESSTNS